MIDTLIFDGEGVVIDTEEIWDRGQEEFLRRHGCPYDRDKIKPLLTGTSVIDGVQALKRELSISGDDRELARERVDIVRGLIEREVEFMDGFEEFYQKVRGTFKTCYATAMDADLLKIVEKRLRLFELFGGNVFSIAFLGLRSKPNPDLFLHAARQLKSRPSDCVVLEDAPYGVEAARRAGMKSIGMATTYESGKLQHADHIVKSYSEIELSVITSLDQGAMESPPNDERDVRSSRWADKAITER